MSKLIDKLQIEVSVQREEIKSLEFVEQERNQLQDDIVQLKNKFYILEEQKDAIIHKLYQQINFMKSTQNQSIN